MNTNKHALLTIFLIIFIDLLGFGLIIPIVPFYLEKFISRPDEIGRTIAAMIKAGLDVARLNFSHGEAEDHRRRRLGSIPGPDGCPGGSGWFGKELADQSDSEAGRPNRRYDQARRC